MNYVFLKAKVYEGMETVDNQLLFIECIKVDNKLNMIDKYVNKINLKDKDEVILINDLVKYFKGSRIIGYDLSKALIALLAGMYRWKIYDLDFWYFDMKDNIERTEKIDTIDEMIKIMNDYSEGNLDNIKYSKKNPKINVLRIFRGLDYKLYLLDTPYYIYDKSPDRYISFYVHRKELEKVWNYTEDEYLFLKNNGGNIVCPFIHISEESIKYTKEYTIYSNIDLSKKNMKYYHENLKKSVLFLKNHPNLDIKLVCIKDLEELKENYKTLDEKCLNKILSLIVKEKELWSKW